MPIRAGAFQAPHASVVALRISPTALRFCSHRHGIRTVRQRQKGLVITAKQNHCGFAFY
jgi:hypothetical protein